MSKFLQYQLGMALGDMGAGAAAGTGSAMADAAAAGMGFSYGFMMPWLIAQNLWRPVYRYPYAAPPPPPPPPPAPVWHGPRFCGHCGGGLLVRARFCGHCGERI